MKYASNVVVVVLSLVVVGFFLPGVAQAAAEGSDAKAKLQQRFKERFPEMERLRASGKVGETPAGTVEVVSGSLDAAVQKVVDAENADRAELYQILARELGTTAEKVAKINGARRIKELRNGEYYKGDDGRWHKKGE